MRHLLKRLEQHSQQIALGTTLALALMLTYNAWESARTGTEAEARERFESRARQIESAVHGRMIDYVQVLRGGLGLFRASESVERHEWREYVHTLKLEEAYPGIQGVGFIQLLRADNLAEHVALVRAEGHPDYAVHPAGVRPESAAVVYIEPFRGRNLRAFGYDMYSEPVRRAAMERARDTADAAMSGKVTLVQETDSDVQAGVLLYLPVYLRGQDPVSLEQRRRALQGYIYAAFRMNNLMRGIVGPTSDIRIEIFDGAPSAENLLYDSETTRPQPAHGDPAFGLTTTLKVHGRAWTLRTTSLPALEGGIDHSRERLVLALGLVVSLMLTALVRLLVTTRERAVTLARRMTSELRASREQIGLALEGSNLALFDWDVNSGRVELSERWNAMLGGGKEATVTTIDALSGLVHPEDQPRLQESLRATLAGRAPFYEVDHRVRTHAGEWKWIASHAKVVERDGSGRALRVAGTNADISDRKAVEQMKNEFIATVSHELRTPLTAIIGSLDLLKEEAAGKLSADAAPFLDMAIQNSDRLAQLVNDILDIEKIEAGGLDLRLAPLVVTELLQRAVTLHAPYAQRLGVAYELSSAAPDATILADEQRMMQVLANLMSNAAKFSPAGQPVAIGAARVDGRVRITVADRGPGIPEVFRARMFEKFAQADGSNTRARGGTGLGLAISKALVDGMGGRLGFDTETGAGTTFWVEFPEQHDTH